MGLNPHSNPTPATKAVKSHYPMNSGDGIYNYDYLLSHAKRLLREVASIHRRDEELVAGLVEHLASRDVWRGRLSKYTYHLKNTLALLDAEAEEASRQD